MSYYKRNLTQSSWNFIDTLDEENNRFELLKDKANQFNNILFNETQKKRVVESCISKCNAKVDLFAKEDPLSDACINNCMSVSLKVIRSIDLIENYSKY